LIRKILLFARKKNNIDNSLTVVSRSIAGGGGIDMEKVVGWRYWCRLKSREISYTCR